MGDCLRDHLVVHRAFNPVPMAYWMPDFMEPRNVDSIASYAGRTYYFRLCPRRDLFFHENAQIRHLRKRGLFFKTNSF